MLGPRRCVASAVDRHAGAPCSCSSGPWGLPFFYPASALKPLHPMPQTTLMELHDVGPAKLFDTAGVDEAGGCICTTHTGQ